MYFKLWFVKERYLNFGSVVCDCSVNANDECSSPIPAFVFLH